MRRLNGKDETLATDVNQFIMDFTDGGEQAISVSVSFVPRYQFSGLGAQSLRDGTATYATTLLRNKRSK